MARTLRFVRAMQLCSHLRVLIRTIIMIRITIINNNAVIIIIIIIIISSSIAIIKVLLLSFLLLLLLLVVVTLLLLLAVFFPGAHPHNPLQLREPVLVHGRPREFSRAGCAFPRSFSAEVLRNDCGDLRRLSFSTLN